MCVEKTPWEQVADFHGHTCPGIALGFRVAQIASRDLGIRPAPESQVLVKAETASCALDAFQVLNHATTGKRTLLVDERGKHVYHFQYSGTEEILRIAVHAEVIGKMSELREYSNPRQKQNKSLEVIQYILSCSEEDFCTVQRFPGSLKQTAVETQWAVCVRCQEPVKAEFSLTKGEDILCLECAG